MKLQFSSVQSRKCYLDTVRDKFELRNYPINPNNNNNNSNSHIGYSFTLGSQQSAWKGTWKDWELSGPEEKNWKTMRDKASGSSTGSPWHTRSSKQKVGCMAWAARYYHQNGTVTGHSLVRHSKEAVGKMRENKWQKGPLAIGYGSLVWCNVSITFATAKALHLQNTHVQYTWTESSRQLLLTTRLTGCRVVKFKKEVSFTGGSQTA